MPKSPSTKTAFPARESSKMLSPQKALTFPKNKAAHAKIQISHRNANLVRKQQLSRMSCHKVRYKLIRPTNLYLLRTTEPERNS